MLLTTKLFFPRSQPQLIARPRLHAALTAGLQGKLIIVTAPPGFGKTTLVADWLDHFRLGILDFGSWHAANPKSKIINPKSTWLSLDEQDNDPVRFLSYLVAALQKVAPGVGGSVQHLLGGVQPPTLIDAATLLLNDLAALEESLLLVLDDYHLIQNPLIHGAMTFLVEHLPPALRLLITSRADPPFPLARWRVRRELCELREQELRFTTAETQAFLQQTLGLELTSSEIDTLEQRTEGWIAGLQLAALSMNGRTNRRDFVQALTGNHAYIMDFLSEEVLLRQPQPIQDFLLRTAILDRLSGPLCAWLMEMNTSGATTQLLLEQLERQRLFLSPLDNERRWYRYHHLFADLLRSRLWQSAPELARQLHRRASDWFAGHGQWHEAIHHALQAHDHLHAADLIEAQVEPLTKRGEHHTLASWIEQLPADMVTARPRLGVAYAFHQLLTHQLERAELALQGVGAALAQGHDPLRGEYLTLKASIAVRRNHFAQAEAWAQEAMALLPATNQTLQARLLVILGIAAYYRDDHEQAMAAFAHGGRLALTAGDLHTALNALSNEALMRSLRGELRRAVATFRHILQIASERGAERLSNIAVVHGYLADVLHELNDLVGMRQHLELACAQCHYCDIPAFNLNQQLYWAKLHQAEGNRSAAVDAVRSAVAIADAHQMPASNRGEVVASQVRL
jgi:LuxR family maltose regulon positive regulatory protein